MKLSDKEREALSQIKFHTMYGASQVSCVPRGVKASLVRKGVLNSRRTGEQDRPSGAVSYFTEYWPGREWAAALGSI